MADIYINIIGDNQDISRNWLYIMILSLVINIFPVIDQNISAHLFFLSLGIFTISVFAAKKNSFVSKITSITSGAGIILIVIFALKDNKNYIESDFFPIYNNLFYIIGISLFFAGIFIQSLMFIIDKLNFCSRNFAITTLAFIIIAAIISFFITFQKLKPTLVGNIAFDHQEFYNIIFCSMSCILLFFFLQLFCFLVIYITCIYFSKEKKFIEFEINVLSVINILAVISSFLSFFLYNIRSYEFINFYNYHLKICGSVIVGCFIFKFIKLINKYSNLKR